MTCSRACRRGSRNRNGAYFRDALSFQNPGARLERGPCRDDIIDEHDNLTAKPTAGTRGRKCASNVAMPSARRKAGLRQRRARSAQGVNDRNPEVSRQVRGLIESSFPVAGPVERHRHDYLGAFEDLGRMRAHERCQWPRQ